MENYTALSLFRQIALSLEKDFPKNEIQSLQKIIFEKKLGLPLHKLYINPSLQIDSKNSEIILDIISQLKLQKPIQYILGETDFFGLNFRLTHDVLIPRQETEELIDWIIKSSGNASLAILDIGTGSGCIAISLASNLKASQVTAIDISQTALKIAQENALNNNVLVDFYNVDILDQNIDIPNNPFDIIVSNPPYVLESEKELMLPNVLEYEPHTALFVSNNDPLIFYRAIARRAKNLLKNEGFVYCEINENQSDKLIQLFNSYNFEGIEIRRDLNGKNRMLKAILK